MTTPNVPPPGQPVQPGADPYTGEPPVEVGGAAEAPHTYGREDFGITPRAIETGQFGSMATGGPSVPATPDSQQAAPQSEQARPVSQDAPPPTTETRTTEDRRLRRGQAITGGSSTGIFVPLGLGTLMLAIVLGIWLLQLSGGLLVLGIFALLVTALLTAISIVDLVLVARRRRREGQDMTHAIGLE